MNICYINPTNNIRRPIAELAKILAKEGHKVKVLYPYNKQCPTKNWVANDIVNKDFIKGIPIKSLYFSPLRYNIPNFFQLFKEIKKIYRRNDCVHIWEYYYPLSVFPLIYSFFNKKNRSKTILTTDGFVGYSYKPKNPWWLVPAFKIYTTFFASFLFRIPRIMTTYGVSMLPSAKKAGVPMRKLKVIPTGIHLDRFEKVNVTKFKELKEEFNITDEKVILFVGMLTERKHPEIVIKISQELLSEGYNIKTILVGDAHGNNPYPKLIKPENKDKIIFAGGRKEIPEFLKLADMLLLPSEGEGLPGVVMEAMAAGLPVVATKEGCTPDLIGGEKEGFLVDNGYYQKVELLLKNKDQLTGICKNSKEKIKRFSWNTISKKYMSLYFFSKTKK
jgi:glycosyltransferase involved in cell wall biosynthesis